MSALQAAICYICYTHERKKALNVSLPHSPPDTHLRIKYVTLSSLGLPHRSTDDKNVAQQTLAAQLKKTLDRKQAPTCFSSVSYWW